MLTFTLWVLVGVVAGFVSRAVAPAAKKKRKRPPIPLTILGVLGAVVAGMICDVALRSGAATPAPDYFSVAASAVGAALVIVIARIIDARGQF